MDDTLVSDVMTTPMLTLDPTTSVQEAARGMSEAGIKSVVVVGEGCRPVGIFTSTDVVRLAAEGVALDEATVDDHMTTAVETVAPDATLSAAAERMTEHDISHLPVTDDDGDGVGILTTTDLATALAGREGVTTTP
jgi:CBS domain-containing protein